MCTAQHSTYIHLHPPRAVVLCGGATSSGRCAATLEDMAPQPTQVQATSAHPRHPELVAQITLMLLPADARDNSVM